MTDSLLFKHPDPSICVQDSDAQFAIHRVYCVGQNYAAHSREMGGDPTRESPFFFTKPADSVYQGKTILYPGETANLHHEVECVVALKAGGYQLKPEAVDDLIYGYTIGLDLTRRDLQAQAKLKGRPWDVAKGFDYSAPVADLILKERFRPSEDTKIELAVNGESRQSANLGDLIWSIPELIAILSNYYHLQAGDLIFTGTPAGVGPLQIGDRVEATIENLTSLVMTVAQ